MKNSRGSEVEAVGTDEATRSDESARTHLKNHSVSDIRHDKVAEQAVVIAGPFVGRYDVEVDEISNDTPAAGISSVGVYYSDEAPSEEFKSAYHFPEIVEYIMTEEMGETSFTSSNDSGFSVKSSVRRVVSFVASLIPMEQLRDSIQREQRVFPRFVRVNEEVNGFESDGGESDHEVCFMRLQISGIYKCKKCGNTLAFDSPQELHEFSDEHGTEVGVFDHH